MTSPARNSPLSTFTPLTSSDPAAIAVIRASGPAFEQFARSHLRFASDSELTAGVIRRAALHDTDGEPIDDIVVSVRSTGPAWDVWLHLHGGPWIMQRCGQLLAAAGLGQTPPDGKSIFPAVEPIDAAIAEQLPVMLTLAGVQWLSRQRELLPRLVHRLAAGADRHPQLVRRACTRLASTYEVFDWYSRPLRIALVGPPNVGKSTLFNRLVGDAVSITSPRAGTTRDYVEAPGELEGYPVIWIDTAGEFEAIDPLDAAGVAAAATASLSADMRVAVLDATAFTADSVTALRQPAPGVVATILNKADALELKAPRITIKWTENKAMFMLSAINGAGFTEFTRALIPLVGRTPRKVRRPAVFALHQADDARRAAATIDHKLLK